MKVLWKLLIVFILIFSITSCKKEKQDKNDNRVDEYTYKFVDKDGTVLKEAKAEAGSTIVYAPNPADKEDEGHIYSFTEWDNNATILSKDEVFNAVYETKLKSFTYTFYDENDVVIMSVTTDYGSKIVYPSDLTKEETEQAKYSFNGWDHNDTILNKNIEFRPVFTTTIKQYTYIFKDYNGTILKKVTADYGTEIVPPEEPTRAATAKLTYIFNGWSVSFSILTRNITIAATYKSVVNKYTYTFKDFDGTILKETTADYGTTIIAPTDPVRDGYRFKGWDKEFSTLVEDIIITATYKENSAAYIVKFFNKDGSLYVEKEVEKDSVIGELPEALPDYADSKYKYVFSGWEDSNENEVDEDTIVYEDLFLYPVFVKRFATLENLTISFLGDSISTFYAENSPMNSYYSGENQFYYPRYSSTIKTVDKTWWARLINENSMKLGINNSWSGSSAYGSGSSAGMSNSRLSTLKENGTPDIVIVYLGTNDLVNGHSVENFVKAIKTIVNYIQNENSDTQIYIANLGYSAYNSNGYTDEKRIAYNEAIQNIVDEYGIGLMDIAGAITSTNYAKYLGDRLHYNALGAERLSIVASIAIHGFNNLEYDKEIVDDPVPQPGDTLCTIDVTAKSDFWTIYETNIFIYSVISNPNPTYSLRIFLSNNGDNEYTIAGISQSGDNTKYSADYVIIVSESYTSYYQIKTYAESMTVGMTVKSENNADTIPNKFSFYY